MGVSPRGPKCIDKVAGCCGGQKPGGEVAYAGKVRESTRASRLTKSREEA